MKRIVLISIALLLAAAGLHAQDILARFSTDRITCKYSYTTTVPFALTFSGDAVVQGECYHFSGNGVEIYCDGESRWTMDPEAKEVYIENAGDAMNILQEFLEYSKDIKYTGNALTGTFNDPEDDNVVKFNLSSIEYTEATDDISGFVLDVEALGDDYVVTDLRY
jgi:hypothetical protein